MIFNSYKKNQRDLNKKWNTNQIMREQIGKNLNRRQEANKRQNNRKGQGSKSKKNKFQIVKQFK